MSDPVYAVLDPFLELKLYRGGCSPEDDERILKAMAAVQANPRHPKGYRYKPLKPLGFYKIEIPLEDDTLAVIYEIWPMAQEIRISDVNELGGLRKVKDTLIGLLDDIVPRKDP